MADLAKLVVRLEAESSRLQKDLDKANNKVARFGKQAQKTANLAKTAFKGVAAGFASVISVQGINASIEAFRRQSRAINQLEARLSSTGSAAGKTSEGLQKTAASLQQVTTFGDEAIIELQGLLLTFTDIRGVRFDQATKSILNVATALGTDLKSATLQVGKALNAPVQGLSALSESGIQFTEDQKKLVKSLVDAGDKAGAQAVILKELEVQFGGAAEAAAEGGGKITQLGNSLGDVAELIGGAIVNSELFNEALDGIRNTADLLAGNNSVENFARDASGALENVVLAGKFISVSFQEIISTLGALGASAAAALTGDFVLIPQIFSSLGDDLNALDKEFKDFLSGVVRGNLGIDKLSTSAQALNKSLADTIPSINEAANGFQKIGVGADSSAKQMERYIKLIDRLFPAQKKATDATEQLRKDQELLDNLYHTSAITITEYNAAILQSTAAYKLATGEIETQSNALSTLTESSEKHIGVITQQRNAVRSLSDEYSTLSERVTTVTKLTDNITSFSIPRENLRVPSFAVTDRGGSRFNPSLITAALQGFATGGQFIVGGNGGTDTTPVKFMATRGERVTVETPEQQRQSSANSNNTFNITMNGVNDVKDFVDQLQQFSRTQALRIRIDDPGIVSG